MDTDNGDSENTITRDLLERLETATDGHHLIEDATIPHTTQKHQTGFNCGVFYGHDLNHKPRIVVRVAAINHAGKAATPNMGNMTAEYMKAAGIDILCGNELNIDTNTKRHYFLQAVHPYAGRCALASTKKGGTHLLWDARYGSSEGADYCGGRITTVLLSVPGTQELLIRAISVYGISGGTAPTQSVEFLKLEGEMNTVLKDLVAMAHSKGHIIVLGGDLNCIEDPIMDAVRTGAVHREHSVLSTLLGAGCSDTFRDLHPLIREATHLSPDRSGNRIDYILVGASDRVLVVAAAIHATPGIATDHRAAFADLVGLNPDLANEKLGEPAQIPWRRFVAACDAAEEDGDEEALINLRTRIRQLSDENITEQTCRALILELDDLTSKNQRHHGARNKLAGAVELLHKTFRDVVCVMEHYTGYHAPLPEPKTVGLLNMATNTLGTIRTALMELTVSTPRVQVASLRAMLEASLSKLELQLDAAHKAICDGFEHVPESMTVEWRSAQLPALPEGAFTNAQWVHFVQDIFTPSIDKLGKRISVALGKEWTHMRRESRQKNLNNLKEGRISEFISAFAERHKGNSGYTPGTRQKADGTQYIPTGKKQILAASRSDFQKIFEKGDFQMPEFIEPYKDEAGTNRVRLGERPQAGEDRVLWDLMHQAFKESRISEENWGDLTRKLSEDETASLNGLCKSKTPGITGTKAAYLRFFPPWVFDLFIAILNCMLALGLIPEQLKAIVVACIPKPTSGFRPLSLYEEVIKAADYILTNRITNVRARKQVGEVLSGTNAAYDKGRQGTSYVIAINECVKEDSLDRNEPLIQIQMDYKSFFDRLFREIAFACMRGYGMPDGAILFYEELYTKLTMQIATSVGKTSPLDRDGSRGVGQGGSSSAEISKWAQEPFMRALEALQNAYHTQSGTRVTGGAFSDDVLILLQATQEAVDELERITSTVLTRTGIPLEVDAEGRAPKIHVHCNTEGAPPVRIGFSDNTTGDGRVVTIDPSLDSSEVRTLLGISSSLDGTSRAHLAKLAKIMNLFVHKFRVKKCGWEEIKVIVRTVLVNTMLYAALFSKITTEPNMVHQWDLQLARNVRAAVKIMQPTCRQGLYCQMAVGGLDIPSMVVETVAAISREILVTLNGDELDGTLARERWDASVEGKLSFVVDAASYLAGYGYMVVDQMDKTAMRIMWQLIRASAGDPPVMTEFFDKLSYDRWSSYSMLSPLGVAVAEAVRVAREDQSDLRVLYERLGLPEWWRDFNIPGFTSEQLAQASGAAMSEAIADRETECYLVGLNPESRGVWGMEDWDKEHGRDLILDVLDRPRVPDGGQEDINAVHPTASFPVLFTDGSYDPDSDTAAFGVVLLRCQANHEGPDLSQAGTVVVAHDTRTLPRHYGTTHNRNHEGELWGMKTGLSMLPEQSDTFIGCDNDSVCGLTQGKRGTGSRARSKGTNQQVQLRLEAGIARLHAQPAGSAWDFAAPEWNTPDSKVMDVKLGRCILMWMRSHQRGDVPRPNPFSFDGNKRADGWAGIRQAVPPDVFLPVGGERFVLTHLGRTITEEPGNYVRQTGKKAAHVAWGNEAKRGMQGAAARHHSKLHKKTQDIRRVCKFPIPEEIQAMIPQEVDHDLLFINIWKLRNSFAGCYTSMVKSRHPAVGAWLQGIAGQAQEVDEGMDMEDMDVNPRKCPVCGLAEGTLRHVCLECTGAGLPELRHGLNSYVEGIFVKNVPRQHWDDALRMGAALGGCAHPKGWQGVDEGFPILHRLGWLMPTDREADFQARTNAGRAVVLETAHDLGYMGLVPTSIANMLLSHSFDSQRIEAVPDPKDDQESPVFQVSNAICVIMTEIRKQYMRALREKLGNVPENEHVIEEEQAGAPLVDEDPRDGAVRDNTFGDAGTQCEGRICAILESTGRHRAVLPHHVTSRAAHRCQICYRADRDEATYTNIRKYGERFFERGTHSNGWVAQADTWMHTPPTIEAAKRRLLVAHKGKSLEGGRVVLILKELGLRWKLTEDGPGTGELKQRNLEHLCRCPTLTRHPECATICGRCFGFAETPPPPSVVAARACCRCNAQGGELTRCAGCHLLHRTHRRLTKVVCTLNKAHLQAALGKGGCARGVTCSTPLLGMI